MKLIQMIDFWAKLKPETPAIMMFDMVITYQALSLAIRSVAGHLSQKKIDTTAPVGILIDHPARNIVVNCALMSLGVPSIVIRENQLDHLPTLGTKTLIYEGQPKSIPGIATVRPEIPWFADPKPPKPAVLGAARAHQAGVHFGNHRHSQGHRVCGRGHRRPFELPARRHRRRDIGRDR